MSVIVEFSIDAEDFPLGQVLSAAPQYLHVELERLVPTGDMVMPFVWVTGDDHNAFESTVQDHPLVRELLLLDRLGDSALYRIEWEGPPTGLIEGIAETEGVVLEASGNEHWSFRLRFPDHAKLTQFHNYVMRHDIPLHLDRTYTLTETTEYGYLFGLTTEQREALVLALQRGYFETPSEANLDELAEELGITRQALSRRIRRGNKQILQTVLLPSVKDID